MKKLDVHSLALDLAEFITNDLNDTHHLIQKENFYPVRDEVTTTIQGYSEDTAEEIAERITEALFDEDYITQDTLDAVYNAVLDSFREALSEIAIERCEDRTYEMAYGNMNDEIDAINREMYG